jgi:FtsZ-binding cell division protein ZapB
MQAMNQGSRRGSAERGELRRGRRARLAGGALLAVCVLGLHSADAFGGDGQASPAAARELEETRLRMSKWIETQQILARERNEWQQSREILVGRVELLRKEVLSLQEKIQQAESAVAEAQSKKAEYETQNEGLKSFAAQLAEGVTVIEADLRRVLKSVPEPVVTKLQPLTQRIPEDPTRTKVSVAERFQNVIGILNELNKAHTDLTVNYEVRTLAAGTPSEVRVLYVGLAQAYYVSAGGEAGIGRPGPDGWTWTPAAGIGGDVLTALDILAGKHSPAFVALPVTIQ